MTGFIAVRYFFAFVGVYLCLFLPSGVFADPNPAAASGGEFLLPFLDDADIAKDFQALAPPFLPWGPNTSGPFFT